MVGQAWRGRGRNNPVGGETSVRLRSGEERGDRGLAGLLESKAAWLLYLVDMASGIWPFARSVPVAAGQEIGKRDIDALPQAVDRLVERRNVWERISSIESIR